MNVTTVGELVHRGALVVSDGYRTKRAEQGRPGYRIIRVADVGRGTVSLESPDFVSEEFSGAIGAKAGIPGDILLTTKGTVGRVAVLPEVNEPVVYSPQLCFFRVQDDIELNRGFLRYWLMSPEFQRQAADRMNNTDMAAYINLNDIRTLQISLPSHPEQQAIAEVLGALDDKIAANARMTGIAGRLASSLYRQLVRHARATTMGELMTLEYGRALPTSARVPGNASVVGSGGIVATHNQAIRQESGTVVGRKGTSGSVHWVNGPHFPIDTTYFVVPKADRASDIFCYFALKSAKLADMNSDSAVPGLNRSEAYAVPTPAPGASEMAEFTAWARPLFLLTAGLGSESAALVALRDILLPHLMSGRLRVKDAEAVVEEAL